MLVSRYLPDFPLDSMNRDKRSIVLEKEEDTLSQEPP